MSTAGRGAARAAPPAPGAPGASVSSKPAVTSSSTVKPAAAPATNTASKLLSVMLIHQASQHVM